MGKKFFMLAFMLATALISTTAFAYSIAHPQDGIYSIQPKCAPGKELSVQNHDRNWGANVIIDNINSGWQKWKIQRIAGTDFYSIIAVHSGLAVDVANATAQNGINIATWPYLGGSQNQFRIWDAGNNYFVIQGNLVSNNSFVLDVVNAENRAGANVWSYGFNGSDAQLWRLEMTQSLPAFQPYNKTASRKVTAYVMPDLQATAGTEYVSAGDNVTVLREEGNAIFVRYPIRNGTKERWVNKNEIFGGSGGGNSSISNGDFPASIYLTQQGDSTCTLVSAAMMLRAKAYLNGDNSWSSITESSTKPYGWTKGLSHDWTYKGMRVLYTKINGITENSLKNLLNQHKEGIVLYLRYLSPRPHAVWVMGYSGNTFYCSDPLSGYSGDKRTLEQSYLGKRKGNQSSILSSATDYWYIK